MVDMAGRAGAEKEAAERGEAALLQVSKEIGGRAGRRTVEGWQRRVSGRPAARRNWDRRRFLGWRRVRRRGDQLFARRESDVGRGARAARQAHPRFGRC